MGIGLLFVNNGVQEMYLPIFHEDREFVLSVLTDAMKKMGRVEGKSPYHQSRVFYEIADDLGRERLKGAHLFIGPEAVSEQCLGGVEDACQQALYIFSVDFDNREIVKVK
ncbi:MAG: hypothetical protein M0Q92_15620 [Methanoregula sp.]|jgi:hypothetical protein|nr:hypothetical protein [Methanoregula sp.]